MDDQSKWYQDGLRFTCTQCGNCCTGAPGTVRINSEEVAELAAFLGMSRRAFRGIYTRKMRGFVSLREKENYDCIFYDRAKGCKVYPKRPHQCRSWPFWQANVESPEAWTAESTNCPGMNHGELHPAEVIELTILNDGTSSTTDS